MKEENCIVMNKYLYYLLIASFAGSVYLLSKNQSIRMFLLGVCCQYFGSIIISKIVKLAKKLTGIYWKKQNQN